MHVLCSLPSEVAKSCAAILRWAGDTAYAQTKFASKAPSLVWVTLTYCPLGDGSGRLGVCLIFGAVFA